jgi:hypothetical protein
MSRKVGVLDLHQGSDSKPITYVKNSVAKLLVRRLLAEWIVKNVLIRHRDVKLSPIKAPVKLKRHKPAVYEHHIEPRIQHFTSANSEWMAYLDGFAK